LRRVETLFSEDLRHGLVIDGALRFTDPFRAVAEQAAGRYRARRQLASQEEHR
jgi:hypothetical protein